MAKRREDQKQYDRTVAGNYPRMTETITGPALKVKDLKYGRNPGSTAALYIGLKSEGAYIAGTAIVKDTDREGRKKDPGYINIEDGNRAIRLTRKIREAFPDYVSASVIKHEIPCGAGRGNSPYEAFENAWAGDPLSAFGGVVALSVEVDRKTAESMEEKKLIEWVIAAGYTGEAMDILNKTNILMQTDPFDKPFTGPNLEVRDVDGGYLVADRYDSKIVSPEFIEVLELPESPELKFGSPTKEDFDAAILQWIIAGHTKSNAVVVGDNYRAHGIGSGQTSRVDAVLMALYKASGRDMRMVLDGAGWAHDKKLVAASDAFWPFPDGPEMLARAGVRGCIYPTGSNRGKGSFEVFGRNNMFVMIPRPIPGDKNTTERAFY